MRSNRSATMTLARLDEHGAWRRRARHGTDDREFDDSDLEEDDAAEIDDPGEDGGEEEPDLGWTVDGSNLGEGEVDFLPPEASGDFNRADYASEFNNVAQKAAFKRPDRRQAWRANRWFIADETNRIRELLFYRAVRQKQKRERGLDSLFEVRHLAF